MTIYEWGLLAMKLSSFAFLRYFILAGIPFLLCYKIFSDKLSLSKIQKKWATKSDFLREISHSLLTNLVLVGMGLFIIYGPLSTYTQFYTDLNAYPLIWIPVSIVLALFIHDTYFYWLHRTMHRPVLFKKVHLVHHLSKNPSPWASFSFHVVEAFLEGLILPIFLFLIPMHPTALLIFALIAFGINVYGHLGFEIMPKGFRRSFWFEILNTSVHHNLHHSHFKGNYGLYFRIWDRLMGTEHPEYVERYDALQANRFSIESKSEKVSYQ